MKPPPTATYPSGCPASGITLKSNGRIDVAGSSILVGIDSYRTIEVVPIDCFPGSCLDPDGRSVLSVELAFSPAERARVERAIADTDQVLVTIPEPHVVNRDWMTELVSADPKPGHVWINGTETVTDLLTRGLVSRRREVPPYPTDSYRSQNETQSPRLTERPATGLTLQIKPTQLLCDGWGDTWQVTTMAGHELVVSLLDCYAKVNVSDLAKTVVERLSKSCSMAITLPPPVDSVDWLDSLKPGTLHAGYIWLGDTTLNQILVDRGIALPS